jgi:hypothetical protein
LIADAARRKALSKCLPPARLKKAFGIPATEACFKAPAEYFKILQGEIEIGNTLIFIIEREKVLLQ